MALNESRKVAAACHWTAPGLGEMAALSRRKWRLGTGRWQAHRSVPSRSSRRTGRFFSTGFLLCFLVGGPGGPGVSSRARVFEPVQIFIFQSFIFQSCK